MSRRRWRVLVADDDPTVALLVRAALPAGEFVTVVADNGDAAWQAWQDEAFDIALLDVEMPGRDGLAVAAAIRQVAGDFPVILVSGRQDADFMAQLVGLAAGHLAKPVDWAALPGVLRARLAGLGD